MQFLPGIWCVYGIKNKCLVINKEVRAKFSANLFGIVKKLFLYFLPERRSFSAASSSRSPSVVRSTAVAAAGCSSFLV